MDRLFTAWPPSPQSGGATQTPRRLTNHFTGDVTVDRPDGLNIDGRTYQATWELPPFLADILVAFLRNHSCKAFLWDMPRDTVSRIWEATDWTRSYLDADRDSVQVTLEERFMALSPAPVLPPPVPLTFRLDLSLLNGSIRLL